MMKIFTSRRCLAHEAPGGYPERPERLALVVDHLTHAPGFGPDDVEEVSGHPAARSAIERTHDPDYVSRFERAVARGDGLLDSADNPLSAGTWGAALAAVEVALTAADWVQAAPDRVAFAAVRPPGHHAERAEAMGFCFFNNVAVVADHLRHTGKAGRVAIVDFDVHHGNGTQHLFEQRADVFFASTHQFPFYPGTGAAGERGVGAGLGATLNVPLAAGAGDEDLIAAYDQHVVPAVEAFGPDILLLSAGFDAWQGDPLGGLKVTEDGFHTLGRRFAELAARHCRGRVLGLLEGGYDLAALPRLVEAHLRGLAGMN